ncbi:MAG: GNAT family N-acetyltransferase [Deltaproteobacteria bacterium]|jgi:GNAT superfamily N-acetyltransferase
MIENDITVRKAGPADHESVIAALQNWWGGRDLTAMLPKLFLNHFNDTSFVIEKEAEMIGFLIGFISPSLRNEAYVHFMGVHPNFRKKGIGTLLYERFFEICRKHDRNIIRACTSPVNRGSVEFHKRIGFQLEPGDDEIDGYPVTRNYNRPGDHKVQFTKFIEV